MTGSRGLVGYSGFVGSTLLRQTAFDKRYRSTDIAAIQGEHFKLLVCAGAPAQKWLANQDPEGDRRTMADLMANLGEVTCEQFVLVSTVDVFADPVGVDERSAAGGDGTTAYGKHRLELEKFVQETFRATVVRLPGLVGPGLRKNVVYDLAHGNALDEVDSRGVFQFYPMVNLWPDIERVLELGLVLAHLSAEPVSVADVAQHGFDRHFENHVVPNPATL